MLYIQYMQQFVENRDILKESPKNLKTWKIQILNLQRGSQRLLNNLKSFLKVWKILMKIQVRENSRKKYDTVSKLKTSSDKVPRGINWTLFQLLLVKWEFAAWGQPTKHSFGDILAKLYSAKKVWSLSQNRTTWKPPGISWELHG